MPIETADEVDVPAHFPEPRPQVAPAELTPSSLSEDTQTPRAQQASEPAALVPEAPPVASGPPKTEPLEAPAAPPQSEPPPPAIALRPPASLPAPPAVSLLPSPPLARPVPWSSRITATQQRLARALPPRAIAIARIYPALWLVAAPVLCAALLIVIVVAMQPEPQPQAPRPAAVRTALPAAAVTPEQPAAAPVSDALDARAVAALDSKDPALLSSAELLLLNDSRAQRKRADARQLQQKLLAQPELAKDASAQAELMRFAADPDTVALALAAMAQAPAPTGPDLLYEVWMSRAAAASTAELARSLLYSRDVRPGASPALAAVLELRAAQGCDAVRSALIRAQSVADNRAVSALVKLTSGRGCGGSKLGDCQACLRANTRQIVASSKAVKSRRAPSYPPLKAR